MREGPMRARAFRLLFYGQAISALGDRLVSVALVFAVLDLTGSVGDLGLVLAAQTVPLIVFVLIGGVWADRLPRQRVMLVSDLVRAGAQGASAALLLSGSAHIWELAALQALYGTAEAFFGPATTALVTQTVPEEHLQQANALMGLTTNVAEVLGPAFAGVLVATAGPGWGLGIDAATFAASAAFLSLLRTVAAVGERPPRESTWTELRAGWRSFRERTWMWVTVGFFTLFMAVAFSPFQVVAPQIARLSLGGAGAWAAISTALGVGAVLGGGLGMRWRPRHPFRVTMAWFAVSFPLLLALVAAHAPLAALIAVSLLDGAAGSLFNALWFTAIQREVPAGELARVTSWDYLGSLALRPVGLALSGPLALAVGFSTTLYGAAALLLALTLAVLAVPSVRNFTMDAPARAGAPGTSHGP